MALNKETQVSASVILEKDTYEQFKQICKKKKRSISSQIAYMIDLYISEYNKNHPE